MVVEDEMLIAMELESILLEQGWMILGPAPTIDRALALLAQEVPDAANLDLNLGGRDAAPVAMALTERGVPFVVASGYGEAQFQQPELQTAPRFDKPVNHSLLVRALRRLLKAA
jgi:DNA-binding LytR/AlgR family response regulator